ncbi:MAG: hypothetical protein RMI74_01655 [Thermodesulfobacterium sp.]|nr:hypothetical protein [Caldimicrobium sp.]MDW8135483.1 hypothetical protein [Thermodesulfobacterium sp.]
MSEIKVDPVILCERIRKIFPEIGECGINLRVEWSEEVQRWTVYLEKGDKVVKTYLEDEEIKACLEGKQCVSLAIQIGQFK